MIWIQGDLRIIVWIMMGLNSINSFTKIAVEIQSWLNIYMHTRNLEHFRVYFLQIPVPKKNVKIICS